LLHCVREFTRFKRSELIEAAHAVIVISAFFEALDDLDRELSTALNIASLEFSEAEQIALASGGNPETGRPGLARLAAVLTAPNSIPGLDAGLSQSAGLECFYHYLAKRLVGFAAGTAAWDIQDETTLDRWTTAVNGKIPSFAIIRYEENLRRLAVDFPEVAFWASRVGIQATGPAVRFGVRAGGGGRRGAGRRDELS
jgi:hypothetical protein